MRKCDSTDIVLEGRRRRGARTRERATAGGADSPHPDAYRARSRRDRRPVSYASAFHQPVKADRQGGHLAPTRSILSQHAGNITQLTGTRHRIAHGHVTQAPEPLEHLGPRHASYDDLVDAVTAAAAAPATAPRSYTAA